MELNPMESHRLRRLIQNADVPSNIENGGTINLSAIIPVSGFTASPNKLYPYKERGRMVVYLMAM